MIPWHRCNTKAIDSATTSTQFNYGVGFGCEAIGMLCMSVMSMQLCFQSTALMLLLVTVNCYMRFQ